MNSRAKGARGEREFRDYLKEHGYTARRGQQFSGGNDSPDVVCEELKEVIHFEVKRTERFKLYDAIKQACDDCPKGKWRVVAHRQSRKDWVAVLPMDDLMDMVKEILNK